MEGVAVHAEGEEEGDDAAHAAPPEDDLELEGDLLLAEDVEAVGEDEDAGEAGDEDGADDDDDEDDVPVLLVEVPGREEEDPEGHEDEDLGDEVEEPRDLEEGLAGVHGDGVPAVVAHDQCAHKEGDHAGELEKLRELVGEVRKDKNLRHLIRG